MASKRARRTKRRTWSKADVQELKAHSRSKSPVKEDCKSHETDGWGASAKGVQPRVAARSPETSVTDHANQRRLYQACLGPCWRVGVGEVANAGCRAQNA